MSKNFENLQNLEKCPTFYTFKQFIFVIAYTKINLATTT